MYTERFHRASLQSKCIHIHMYIHLQIRVHSNHCDPLLRLPNSFVTNHLQETGFCFLFARIHLCIDKFNLNRTERLYRRRWPFFLSMSCQRLDRISSLSQVFAMKRIIDFRLSVRLVSAEDASFRRYHRPAVVPSNDSDVSPGTPFITVIAISVYDYFAVVNCSTSIRVPQSRLDWYFKTSASLDSPRVIWQSGRAKTHRYTAYSPDQIRHYLQIKPIHLNDSGTYTCLDQETGSQHEIELVVRKFADVCRRRYLLRHNILRFQFALKRASILALLSLHQSSSAEQLNFEIAFCSRGFYRWYRRSREERERMFMYRQSWREENETSPSRPHPAQPTKLTGIFFVLGDSRSCAGCTIRLQMSMLVCLVLLSSILSRRTASESEVTWSPILCCIHTHYTCQCASSVHSHSCWIISNKEDLEGSTKSPCWFHHWLMLPSRRGIANVFCFSTAQWQYRFFPPNEKNTKFSVSLFLIYYSYNI